MKLAIGAALAAVTAATAAAAETPDELIYLICHGDRVGEVFVMTQTDDGIGSVSSHPGVEIIHQDDGARSSTPMGPSISSPWATALRSGMARRIR